MCEGMESLNLKRLPILITDLTAIFNLAVGKLR